jgi:hypothetical protein
MKDTDILKAFTEWVLLYCGIQDVPDIVNVYNSLKIIPTVSRTLTQQALWIKINSCVVDFAQNGPRPSSPYITTHMQSVLRHGTTPYRSNPQLNVSQLITMNGDFVTGNVIGITINSIAIPTVTFTTDNEITYGLLQTAIESVYNEAAVSVDSNAHTILIYQPGKTFVASINITGGSSRPTAVVSAPYSFVDTTVYYIEKVHLYLQSYGDGSDNYMQNLQQSLLKEHVIDYLKAYGISYLSDTGILDIHTLIDETYEERFSFDLLFSVGQVMVDTTYDITTVPYTSTIND